MDVFLNILIILLAIIIFLVVYYYTSRTDHKRKDYHLPLNQLELEAGAELGVDTRDMQPKVDRQQGTTDISKNVTEHYSLPDKYNENFIRLFARDPAYLYTYWEINNQDFYHHQPVIRLFDQSENSYTDLAIDHGARDWYIKCKANNCYQAVIGYKKEGVFYPLSYSNQIRTPLDRPSDLIDQNWMTIEELSQFKYRIEVDSSAMLKQMEAKRIEADSFSLVKKE